MKREIPSGEGNSRTSNVLKLVKDGEQFFFYYDDESTDALFQQFGKDATDKDLNFTWYDAAVLSQKVRSLLEEKAQEKGDWSRSTTW